MARGGPAAPGATVDDYKLLTFFHVFSVVVGLGVTFALPFLHGFVERRGVGPTRLMLEFSLYLEKFVILPGAALVFLFGLGLIFTDTTGYKDDMPVWLEIAIAWFVVAIAVSVFVQRRQVKEALAALEGVPDDGGFPAAYMAVTRRIQAVGGLLGLSVLGIGFLMVWKP
jgi:hypothetical protein